MMLDLFHGKTVQEVKWTSGGGNELQSTDTANTADMGNLEMRAA
jgi:hypothetical protein